MRSAVFILACLASPLAHAADCATELKPTDTFKELSAKLKCLNDRISVLEKGGAIQAAARPHPQPVSGGQTQEAGGLKIEMEQCSKAAGSVSCRIAVTALDSDREALFRYESRAVDHNGVVLTWKGYQTAGGPIERRAVKKSFIGNIRTSAMMYFDAENTNVSNFLSAIQIKYSTERGREDTVTFKDIALN